MVAEAGLGGGRYNGLPCDYGVPRIRRIRGSGAGPISLDVSAPSANNSIEVTFAVACDGFFGARTALTQETYRQSEPWEEGPDAGRTLWSAHRRDLLEWLSRRAPSLGELYEGSVVLTLARRVRGWTRLVCHAVREIMDRLPKISSGQKNPAMFQFSQRLDRLADIWGRNGLLTGPLGGAGGDTSEAETEIPVPADVFEETRQMIQEYAASRLTPEQVAERLYVSFDPESKHARRELRPVLLQWIGVRKWFVKRAHDSGKPDADHDEMELQRQFALFERCFGALVRPFYETIGDLDEILEEANS